MNERTNERTNMPVPSHIVTTLAELRAKRDFLDTAINVLAQIYEGEDAEAPAQAQPRARPLPAREPAPKKSTRVTTPANGAGPTDDVVRAALKRGPLSSSAFRRALKLDRYRYRELMRDLMARGVVVVTGATSGMRIALESPAKEAP